MPTPRDSDCGAGYVAGSTTDPWGGPMHRFEYYTEVNKGSINMRSFTGDLNKKGADGWRLAHVFEQSGNTITVFERVLSA